VRAARQNLARALRTKERLAGAGLTQRFNGAFFNEVAYKVPGGDAQAFAKAALKKASSRACRSAASTPS